MRPPGPPRRQGARRNRRATSARVRWRRRTGFELLLAIEPATTTASHGEGAGASPRTPARARRRPIDNAPGDDVDTSFSRDADEDANDPRPSAFSHHRREGLERVRSPARRRRAEDVPERRPLATRTSRAPPQAAAEDTQAPSPRTRSRGVADRATTIRRIEGSMEYGAGGRGPQTCSRVCRRRRASR